VELSEQDFTVGRWQTALQAAASAPLPLKEPPAPTGAADAAQALSHYLK
jgi:hypothetical protein